MGSSEQHLANPNPLSFPPQLAAKCVKRDKRPLRLSADNREMKLDRLLERIQTNYFIFLLQSEIPLKQPKEIINTCKILPYA